MWPIATGDMLCVFRERWEACFRRLAKRIVSTTWYQDPTGQRFIQWFCLSSFYLLIFSKKRRSPSRVRAVKRTATVWNILLIASVSVGFKAVDRVKQRDHGYGTSSASRGALVHSSCSSSRKGWPGWVHLGSWLCLDLVYTCTYGTETLQVTPSRITLVASSP